MAGPGTEGEAFAALWGRALGACSGPGGKSGVILPSGQIILSGASYPGPSSFTSLGALSHLLTLVWSYLPRRPPDSLPLSLPTAWSQDHPRCGRDHSDLSILCESGLGDQLADERFNHQEKTVSSKQSNSPPNPAKASGRCAGQEGLCAASVSAGGGGLRGTTKGRRRAVTAGPPRGALRRRGAGTGPGPWGAQGSDP